MAATWVFAGDEMRGLFDFDAVNRGPLAYDVAVSAYAFGRAGRGLTPIRAEVVETFLAGYASTRPLTDEERPALPAMAGLGCTPHPGYYSYLRREGLDLTARLRQDIGKMGSLERGWRIR